MALARDDELRRAGVQAMLDRLREAPIQRPGLDLLPHQIPPDWNDHSWDTFLLLAGRGCGKTQAGSHYINELLTTHRGWHARIIAPTIGDAREACVIGPSGLLNINPALKWRINEGAVLWPNGSRCRLFGAFSPEDVERLRAGGNCFARGQRIRGEFGWRPIEEIEVGERVWTRDGLRPVIWSGSTGRGTVWELETEAGRRLRVTAEHKVWTERGFVPLDQLRQEDVLWAWNGSNGETCDGIDGRPATTRTRVGACSIARSGKRPTGRSPRDTSYITATTIAGITAWRTWNASRSRNTEGSTVESPSKPSPPLRLGGPATKVLKRLARTAVRSTALAAPSVRDSALTAAPIATTSGPEPGAPTSMPTASFVAPGSEPGSAPRLVRDRVLRCTPIGSEDLFDLTVDGRHEVFAEGILAHQSAVDWYEELAAWPRLEEALDQAMFGLRLGEHPRAIITTTPKPRERLRKLIAHPKTRISRASTRDNPHLSETVRSALFAAYEGTRLGRQELEAELLTDIEGALWRPDMIDPVRVTEPPMLLKTVVAVDPAKTSRKDSDLTGMIVVARGADDHGYVLADLSGRYTPAGWAKKAIWAYDHFECSYITCETNIAGELVTQNIHSLDSRVPVRGVRSRQSKHGRALPAASLYEQHRVHHVGVMTALENEQYAFTGAGDNTEEDDRIDALVLGIQELSLTREVVEPRGWRVYV